MLVLITQTTIAGSRYRYYHYVRYHTYSTKRIGGTRTGNSAKDYTEIATEKKKKKREKQLQQRAIRKINRERSLKNEKKITSHN